MDSSCSPDYGNFADEKEHFMYFNLLFNDRHSHQSRSGIGLHFDPQVPKNLVVTANKPTFFMHYSAPLFAGVSLELVPRSIENQSLKLTANIHGS